MRPAVALLEFASIAAGDRGRRRHDQAGTAAGDPGRDRASRPVPGAGRRLDRRRRGGAGQAGRRPRPRPWSTWCSSPTSIPTWWRRSEASRRRGPGRRWGSSRPPTAPSVIDAADAGVKGARVVLQELCLADDLGGKGYALFGGEVSEVEAAVEHGRAGSPVRAGGRGSRSSPGYTPRWARTWPPTAVRHLGSRQIREPRIRRPGSPSRCLRRDARCPATGGGRDERMQLAGVTGTVVATVKADGPGGREVPDRAAAGPRATAARAVPWWPPTRCTWRDPASWSTSSGRREAAQALPNTFVPVDHAIVGHRGRGRRPLGGTAE